MSSSESCSLADASVGAGWALCRGAVGVVPVCVGTDEMKAAVELALAWYAAYDGLFPRPTGLPWVQKIICVGDAERWA